MRVGELDEDRLAGKTDSGQQYGEGAGNGGAGRRSGNGSRHRTRIRRWRQRRRLDPPRMEPSTPRMICRPTSEPTARAALLTIASPADWRCELPPPNTLPSTSPSTEPAEAGAGPGGIDPGAGDVCAVDAPSARRDLSTSYADSRSTNCS